LQPIPVKTIIMIGAFAAHDPFNYLARCGISILLLWVAGAWARALPHRVAPGVGRMVVAAPALAALLAAPLFQDDLVSRSAWAFLAFRMSLGKVCRLPLPPASSSGGTLT